MTIFDGTTGDNDGILDPGETAELQIRVLNQGHADAGFTTGWINSVSPHLNLITDTSYADSVCASDTILMRFTISANDSVIPGTPANILCKTEYLSYNVQKEFTVVIGLIPEYRMKNGVETVSNGTFFDTGGETGKYQNYENYILTFLPKDTTKKVQIHFQSFAIEQGWDYLYVYNGADSNAQQIAGSPFTGTSITPVITASNIKGALTFRFYADEYVTDNGWEADISCISLVDADDRNNDIPNRYDLSQNYPNPFNPVTSIRYSIPSDGKVILKVYNILGQEVVSLVNGLQKAGRHTVIWNGKDANGRAAGSGLYLYRIQAGNFTLTRKMLLVK
jgi:hypothetical protein